VRPEGLEKLKKFIHLIGSCICDLPAFSIVPQPLRYRVTPVVIVVVVVVVVVVVTAIAAVAAVVALIPLKSNLQ
jgi:hypothetical protein